MDDIEETLRRHDAAEFSGRCSRFGEVVAWLQVPEQGLSLGPDWEASQSFLEARFAYVNGFWLSAIIMSQVAIERHLAWRLSRAGIDGTESMTAKSMTDRALLLGAITDAEAGDFTRLRAKRNRLAHFRSKSRFWTALFAAVEAITDHEEADGVDVNLVLHADAKDAVKIATAYFVSAGKSHPPYGSET